MIVCLTVSKINFIFFGKISCLILVEKHDFYRSFLVLNF